MKYLTRNYETQRATGLSGSQVPTKELITKRSAKPPGAPEGSETQAL